MPALVFDFGLRFIGVATAEPRAQLASPLKTIRAKQGQPHWPPLDQAIDDWAPNVLVVGLPLNMDDTESDMSKRARAFGRSLTKRYSIPVEFADERLSTFEAAGREGTSRPDHALAAVVIAETWMSSRSDT